MKFYLTIPIFLMLCFVVSAEQSDLGIFKQGTCFNLYQTCDDCSYVNFTSMKYPNGTIENFNLEMTKTNQNFNYTFCNSTQFGDYSYTVCGDKGGTFTCEVIGFSANYLGKELSISTSILYISLFVILILFMLSLFFVISMLPNENQRDEEGALLSISKLKYLRYALWFVEWMLVIAVIYLSSNLAFAFSGEQLFAKILFNIFRITLGVTPIIVIVWIIWMFVRIKDDVELNRLMERGIFNERRF